MNSTDTFILFELGHASYALRSSDVLHVEMLEHITPVPNAASAVEGIVFSRGHLYPALNLRARFGLERIAHTAKSRLLFVRVHERTVALVVDSAREFRRIPAETIRAADGGLHGIPGNYVQGVATVNGRLVLLLDLVAVLNLDDVAPIVAAEQAILHSHS
jgi:purine-binding chemotaxis protein CheW